MHDITIGQRAPAHMTAEEDFWSAPKWGGVSCGEMATVAFNMSNARKFGKSEHHGFILFRVSAIRQAQERIPVSSSALPTYFAFTAPARTSSWRTRLSLTAN